MAKLEDYIKLNEQYVLDLKAIDTNKDDIEDIATTLDTIYGDITGVTINSSDLIADQSKVQTILTDEQNRLDTMAQEIDNATYGQKRMVHFNQSYSDKYRTFNKILYAIIVSAVLVIALIYQQKWFDVIPEFINTLLYIAIFAILTIYIMFTIVEIATRDNMNFDKLKVPPPKILSTAEQNRVNNRLKKEGKLLEMSDICKGAECCPDGFSFDSALNICAVST